MGLKNNNVTLTAQFRYENELLQLQLIFNTKFHVPRHNMATTIEIPATLEFSDAKNNDSSQLELPIDMRFNQGHIVSIVTYSVLMVISAIGNITVLTLILRRKRTCKSRIHTMLMHLAIADLLVTFLMMPLEIGWAITVSWEAGDAMCRITAFFRVFGLYLSSFVLVCISMDRYYAVIRPLQLLDIDKRGKVMLSIAWVGSVLCSMPQMIIFHVESHPNITWYSQCVTFNTFPTYTHELTYSLFGMVMMYWFPLIVIIYTYTSILLEICRRSKESEEDRIRRSSMDFLTRARIRTLKMTIIIVTVFFICWTPYYVMSLWYWIDRYSASKVDQRIQRGLFLFACTNSCMNPIVYGAFNIRDRKKEVTSQKIESIVKGHVKSCSVSWRKARNESSQHLQKLEDKSFQYALAEYSTSHSRKSSRVLLTTFIFTIRM